MWLLDSNLADPSTVGGISDPEKRFMAGKARTLGTRVVTSGTTLTILGNVLGACLMFIPTAFE